MAFQIDNHIILLTIHEVVFVGNIGGGHALAGQCAERAGGIIVAELTYDELLHHDVAGHGECQRSILLHLKATVVPAVTNGWQCVETVAPYIVSFVIALAGVLQLYGFISFYLIIFFN